MKIALSNAIKHTAHAGGWYQHQLSRDAFPGVAVLCYHGVRPDGWRGDLSNESLHVTVAELEAHCRFARTACTPISLQDWRAALEGRAQLPARPVLFTFDDGYRTVFTEARPVLERYEIPGVVFVCTTPVRDRVSFWFDAMAREQGVDAVERAKAMDRDEWAALIAAISRPVKDDDPHAPMRVEEVRALAQHPSFEIGGHTASHPILRSLSRERQSQEIGESLDTLREWTGRPVRSFAYPNGQPGVDYTAQSVSIAHSCGVDFAFTTEQTFADADADRLQQPRFVMLSGVSGAELAHRLTYSWRAINRAS